MACFRTTCKPDIIKSEPDQLIDILTSLLYLDIRKPEQKLNPLLFGRKVAQEQWCLKPTAVEADKLIVDAYCSKISFVSPA